MAQTVTDPSKHATDGRESTHAAPSGSAVLEARDPVRAPHDSLVAALEAGARADAPFLTLYATREPVALPARAALDGARRWASALRRAGVERGDRVPLLMTTSADFVEAFLGTMLLGAVPAPLASPMTFGAPDRYLRNLEAVVRDADAHCIVTTTRMRDAIATGTGTEIRDQLETVLTAEDAAAAAELGTLPSIGGGDLALLQYTSGTTGHPKGVAITHRALVSNAFAIHNGLAIGASDVGVSWLPMFHDMGLIGVLVTALCHPYPVHVMPPESFVMQPRRWLERISSVRGTISASPNFGYELCVRRGGEPDAVDLTRWRAALSGAEPVHASTIARFSARFDRAGFARSRFMPVYGLAESTLAVTFPALDRTLETLPVERASLTRDQTVSGSAAPDAHHAVSVGAPVAGTTVRVTNESGGTLPTRVVGEIRVRGASLMEGYFRNERASADAIVDGWLCTGDLGFIDEGRLFVVGRAKDVVIKAGRNIHPADVERVAEETEGVIAAAAFGRANDETGTDDLFVACETREKDPARREALERAVAGELLARLSVKADGVALWPVSAIPRTTSGKIRRTECVRLWNERGST